MASKKTNTTASIPAKADKELSFDSNILLDKVFGPVDHPFTDEEVCAAIGNLDAEELQAIYTYLGFQAVRYKTFIDCANKKILEDLASTGTMTDNLRIDIADSAYGKPMGTVHIYKQTSSTVTYSSANSKTRQKIIDAITQAVKDQELTREKAFGTPDGKTKGFIKETQEIQNELLVAAKEQGLLPSSVADLVEKSVTTKETQRVEYVAPPKSEKEGE